jgi:uroporphyrin-III C-methyltransferase
MNGKVYLVGAGPGDPELLTLKAMRVLQSADVVLHDELVPPEILRLAPAGARVYNVGKRCGKKSVTQSQINALMLAGSLAGLTVVRLKGGDPLVFGRAGEEIEALRQGRIDFEIVPGVTATLAAAAAAQVALTDRRHASQLVFLTGHQARPEPDDGMDLAPRPWAPLSPHATVVVYMPGSAYARLAAELCEAGLRPGTPCLLVSRASQSDQRIFRTTLEKLAQAPRLPAPSLLLLGAIAAPHPDAEADDEQLRASALSPVTAGQAPPPAPISPLATTVCER